MVVNSYLIFLFSENIMMFFLDQLYSWPFMGILQADVSVDTFFLLRYMELYIRISVVCHHCDIFCTKVNLYKTKLAEFHFFQSNIGQKHTACMNKINRDL